MSEKILVTGVNGFVGHHVANQLHENGYEVVGTGLQPELQDDLVGVVDEYIECNLTDPDDVKKIDLTVFRAIINLAGFAAVGDSKGKGELYDRVNIGVHTVLYDECLRQNASPRIIAVSTGAVYDPNQPLPQTEESKLHDVDNVIEYIASKIKMENAVAKYREEGLDVIIARPLNHTGPGQLPGFLIPDMGAQIEEAVEQNKPLLTGNLDTNRDYTDVRDVAKAYVLLATTDRSNLHHNIYNICSGESVLTKDVVKKLATEFGAPDIKMEIDPKRVRANDIMDIYGSSKKLREDTGWKPTISVDQMIHDYAEWKKAN